MALVIATLIVATIGTSISDAQGWRTVSAFTRPRHLPAPCPPCWATRPRRRERWRYRPG